MSMWVSIKRILRAGFTSFWRNAFITAASILVTTVTLFVLGSLVFLDAMLEASLGQLQSKVDVNVYFTLDATESEITTLKENLEQLPEVALVEYVSREQALEEFTRRHENDQLIIQALEELEDNPLGAHLNIRAKETSQYESIANFLESDNALGAGNTQIIEKVNYFQNKDAIDKLSRLIGSIDTLSFAVLIIFIIISIAIVFNTIRLAIYTAREEIAVMKLVGASNGYIRWPFVLEGMMYGIVSAVFALIIFYPVTIWLGPFTENFFGATNVFDYYVDHFGQMFLILVISGISLGAVSSYLAVRKYLEV